MAIGAVLSQKSNDDDLPIAYASRCLNKAERNYSTIERELLSIVWATKKFRPYLYGFKFVILTDHKPLIYLYSLKESSSRLIRWRLELSDFQFDIAYKPGKLNANADALSRIQYQPAPPESSNILVTTRSQNKNSPLSIDPLLNAPSSQNPPSVSLDSTKSSHSSLQNSSNQLTTLKNPVDIQNVIREYHSNPLGGHHGITKTFQKLKTKFIFPKMLSTISNFIKSCDKCQKNKVGKINRMPLKITTTADVPFEKLFMDIVGPLPVTHNNSRYILTMQDDLSKMCVAVALAVQDAESVASAFVEHFVCIYGAPKIIVTDQGTNFVSDFFKTVCKILKIRKFQATAYHPETNGGLERSHRGLAEYLRNYIDDDPLTWDNLLPFAMFAYNTSVHSATSFMPFEIIFGFKPNFPTSFPDNSLYSYNDYLADLHSKLKLIYEKAQKNLIQAKQKSKNYYDRYTNPSKYHVGDFVLLRKRTKTKLEPLWSGPHPVIKVPSTENTTIRIKNKLRTYHNNNLKKYQV